MFKRIWNALRGLRSGTESPAEDKWGMVLTLRLSDIVSNRFKALMEQAGTDEPKDIVWDAIRLYEHLVLEEVLGTEFYVKDSETGEFVAHRFFGSESDDDDERDEE